MTSLRFTLLSLLIAVIVFAGVAPTLTWLDFNGGSENLVVESVLEMRRGGPWLIPTFNDAPRTTKPPLTSWICAAFVRPETVSALSDPIHRESAYRELAWEVRWPALAFGCLTLMMTAWMGRILISDSAGLIAMVMMASTVMFLRFGRWMTTDMQLALWVTTANVFFSLALFEGRRWLGCVGGAIAVGLALMSKGPVALAQTLVPVAVFVAWRLWTKRQTHEDRIGWWPVIAGAGAAFAIAFPWPIWVATRMTGEVALWWSEVTHGGSEDYGTDPLWSYLTLIPLVLPWTALFFLGITSLFRNKSERGMLALLIVLAPIVMMTCFKEKNERYLQPMLGPAAVVCVAGLVCRDKSLERLRHLTIRLTWTTLLVLSIGLPLSGALFLTQVGGGPWWPLITGILMASCATGILAFAWILDPSRERLLVPVSFVAMLSLQISFINGYARTRPGQSASKHVADLIATTLPRDAEVWCYAASGRFNRVPSDMPIYLNRIIRQAQTPATLPASSEPHIMFVHCFPEEAVPTELENWRLIGTFEENKGVWYAFTQPSALDP